MLGKPIIASGEQKLILAGTGIIDFAGFEIQVSRSISFFAWALRQRRTLTWNSSAKDFENQDLLRELCQSCLPFVVRQRSQKSSLSRSACLSQRIALTQPVIFRATETANLSVLATELHSICSLIFTVNSWTEYISTISTASLSLGNNGLPFARYWVNTFSFLTPTSC